MQGRLGSLTHTDVVMVVMVSGLNLGNQLSWKDQIYPRTKDLSLAHVGIQLLWKS